MRKLLSVIVVFGLMTSTSLTPMAVADVAPNVLPNLNNASNATVTQTGADMNIQINATQGGVGTLNWNSYNIGKDASVNYEFTAHNQTALNKVSATGGMSQIYGQMTNSGCYGCGYADTGKVILINPNGVLFGDGANVNLNSLTVTTHDAVFNKDTNTLELVKTNSDGSIYVKEGANIYGDKNVALAANNIYTYAGSKISTNVAPNVNGTDSFGKVKLITSDGVNFAYYNNGAVKGMSNIKESADKMSIILNGDIKAGNIDVRNYSTEKTSEINLKDATLKATKAEIGNDGNIWLTASNKVVTEGSKLETVNYSDAAKDKKGGNIHILSGAKASIATTDIDSVGNVDITSQLDDVAFDDSTIDTAKDVIIIAGNVASIQNNSVITAGNVSVAGKERAQTINSQINSAKDITLEANDIWLNNSDLTAANDIKATAKTGMAKIEGNVITNAKNISIDAAGDVKTVGKLDIKNNKLNIVSGKDVDVTLVNASNREKGINLKGANDVAVSTDSTLSVSSIVAGNDVTINSDKVIAGKGYTTVEHLNGETGVNRSYIEVGGKNFNSNTANDSYEVTASGDLTADGKFNKKHHIQYGEGAEKILLIHNRPYVAPTPETQVPPVVEPVQPTEPAQTVSNENDQAQMLNKLPRQPEVFNNTANITNGRTQIVDVFAAASQIEIEEDEE